MPQHDCESKSNYGCGGAVPCLSLFQSHHIGLLILPRKRKKTVLSIYGASLTFKYCCELQRIVWELLAGLSTGGWWCGKHTMKILGLHVSLFMNIPNRASSRAFGDLFVERHDDNARKPLFLLSPTLTTPNRPSIGQTKELSSSDIFTSGAQSPLQTRSRPSP